jgi:hypothetical protein
MSAVAAAAVSVQKLAQDGFVVIENAVPLARLRRLRTAFEKGMGRFPPAVPMGWDIAAHASEYADAVQPVEHQGGGGAGPHGITSRRYPDILQWGSEFVDLVDNPAVGPLLTAALGTNFILDHDYGHALQAYSPAAAGVRRKRMGRDNDGATAQQLQPVVRGQLHNVGAVPAQPSSSGRLWRGTSNLITVVYDLFDAQPADGGFGCIAGSHREGYELPIARAPHPSRGYPSLVTRVPCRAGACIVFTELLHHCTLPWVGQGERRTIFLKFSPAADLFSAKSGGGGAAARKYQPLDRPSMRPPLRQILGLRPSTEERCLRPTARL